jgi:hypothetical protein
LDEGSLHSLGVEASEGNVKVEVHTLLVHSQVKDARGSEARSFEEEQVQESCLGRMGYELKVQFGMQLIHSYPEGVGMVRRDAA